MATFTGSSSTLFPGYAPAEETVFYDTGVAEAFTGILTLEGSGAFPSVEFADLEITAYDALFDTLEGTLVLTGSSSTLQPDLVIIESADTYNPTELGVSGFLDNSFLGSISPLNILLSLVEEGDTYNISVDSASGGVLGALPGGAGLVYRMRGFDTTLSRDVYWTADLIDTNATQYTGPGPVIEVVVSKIIGT